MLWAIDVGNTNTVIGLYDGTWRAVWRMETRSSETEDEFAATLGQLCTMSGLPFEAEGVVVGSVVPTVKSAWAAFSEKWLGSKATFLERGDQVGLTVSYDPHHAVGADRIANAIAAIEKFGFPIVVVDFGTATTFDTIDSEGSYLGGAIMPGVLVSVDALAQRAAKLPPVSLTAPGPAVGTNTVDALKSGVMYGYAGAVDGVCKRIIKELGGEVRVIGTGGLAGAFLGLCDSLQSVEPYLTLDGLVLGFSRMTASP